MAKFLTITSLSIFLALGTAPAHTVEYAKSYAPDLQKIGEGRFSFMG